MNNKLTKARTQLVLDHPFFGSLALRLKLVEDESVDSAYTDGVVIGYNPAFIDRLTLPETKWLIAHEVMHIALMHHTRRKSRDIKRWNKAADYIVNLVLHDAGFTHPQGILFNPSFAGKSAEDIYALLPEEQSDGDEGIGDNYGEVRDAPDGVDPKQAEAQVRVQMAQALQQAKLRGNIPGCVARLVQEILYPPLDWREILRHFVEEATRSDYSWLNPSRRYAYQGIVLPSLNSKELGNIVIAVDTSGSIDMDALSRFAAEISAVLESYDTVIDVLCCDTKIRYHQQYGRQDLPLNIESKGGGGTSFIPVFEWVEEQGVNPCCLIYLTDLECSRFPINEPGYPVLWVQTGNSGYPVPFGDVIRMN
jgi:predicted metal-dependent peptidase